MAEVRGTFDQILDQIVTTLETYEAEQILVDASYAYTVEPDYYRGFPAEAGAYVFVYMGPIVFEASGTARATQHAVNVTYYIDMVSVSKGDDRGVSYERGDKLAGERNRYLMQQVMTALYRPDSFPDLGMPIGTIAKRKVPRIEPLEPDDERKLERPVAGARMTMDMDMAWDPTEVTGPTFAQLHVDAGRFAALYDYGG